MDTQETKLETKIDKLGEKLETKIDKLENNVAANVKESGTAIMNTLESTLETKTKLRMTELELRFESKLGQLRTDPLHKMGEESGGSGIK